MESKSQTKLTAKTLVLTAAVMLLLIFSLVITIPIANGATSQAKILYAYTQGQSGGAAVLHIAYPRALVSGEQLLVSVSYYSTSGYLSINPPYDTGLNQWGPRDSLVQSNVNGEYFGSQWFVVSSVISNGLDLITASVAPVAAATICVSIFESTGYSLSPFSSGWSIGSTSPIHTNSYSVPTSGVSLVSSIADSSSVFYTAGSGYVQNNNANGGSCSGEFSTTIRSTNAQINPSVSSNWLDSGLSIFPVGSTTSDTSSSTFTSTTSTLSSSTTSFSTSTFTTFTSSTSTFTNTSTSRIGGFNAGCSSVNNPGNNPFWNACSQKLAKLVIAGGWNSQVGMLHDINESGCTDYVGGYKCDNTFWTTSDNIPTCWTLGDFGFASQMNICKTTVTLLGAFTVPNDGMRYEPFAGYPIITGNPGDHHTILQPPNGQNQIICTNLPCTGNFYGILSNGQYYAIQSDAWNGQGRGTPHTGVGVDIEAPQAINAWLRGDILTFVKLLNDLEGRYNSSGYIGAGSTWQLGQVMFVMQIGGRGNTHDFLMMAKMLWSLQSAAGYLPNTYSGLGRPGNGHDPENEDAGLLPFAGALIATIIALKGHYNANSPPQ